MRIYIPKEAESRVAATPPSVKLLAKHGTVVVEKGCGLECGFSDEEYTAQGATITTDGWNTAELILKVAPPTLEEWRKIPPKATLIGMLQPFDPATKQQLEANANHITAFALELMPRVTKAQSMDVLSSQNNLMGYQAVLRATQLSPKALPLMMTAAGTVAAAKVLIIGVGVAGLQAIATAKRLGAVVSAFDVRAETAEQVESLGAKFIKVEGGIEENSVYADKVSEEYKKAQSEALKQTLPSQDIVIASALTFGGKAPTVLTAELVAKLKKGAVVMDCAAAYGGNCELSKVGETYNHNGVIISAPLDLVQTVAKDASNLYARNIAAFVTHLFSQESEGEAKGNGGDKSGGKTDLSDEITAATCIYSDGKWQAKT